ncbi:EamA family transporter [Rhodovibrionaceae bacterium A322]
MSLTVVAVVLLAALLHASWNALAKSSPDRLVTMTLFALTSGLISACLLPFVPLPTGEAWFWILASALLHTGYKQMLVRAYGAGDLSQVYPLARGAAPLLVTAFSLLFLDENLTSAELTGMAILLLGVVTLSYHPGESPSWPMLVFAFATASFTAAYTLVDGLGARVLGHAVSFSAYLHLIDSGIMLTLFRVQRGKGSLSHLRLSSASGWQRGFGAAALSFLAFTLVIWAMTQAPIALVAALREVSILFALLLSIVILKEKPSGLRLLSGGLILAGLLITRLA